MGESKPGKGSSTADLSSHTSAEARVAGKTTRVQMLYSGAPRFEEYKQTVPHRFTILAAEYK